jgi:histidyl-tRNA synthetase
MSENQPAGRRIKAQVLSGFRDQLPGQMLLRRVLIDRFRSIFEAHGFEPIDTPTLEHLEVLTGKAGENEKLMYHFLDHGDRAVGLRYDLTVPLARFVANHQNDLPIPFKRYHIAPVWRAEKAQRGRFREFWQCDADIVGSSSAKADAESISMVAEILEAAGLPNFIVHISHRKLLEGIALASGVPVELASTIYRAVDKLDKIGAGGVHSELISAGISDTASDRLLAIVGKTSSNLDHIEALRNDVTDFPEARAALDNLDELFRLLETLSPDKHCFKFDLTLARGLDYYTGIVYEATVDEPKVGSVSGGGRYDGLVGMFSGRDIPAMGISIGLERIIEVAEEFNLVTAPQSVCDAIVIYHDSTFAFAAALARKLRQEGLNIDMSLLGRKSFGDQLKYADRRGIPFAVLIGEDEASEGVATVKALATGDQRTVSESELVTLLSSHRER